MLRAIRKPFGYEPIITKEDIKGPGKRKKRTCKQLEISSLPDLEICR